MNAGFRVLAMRKRERSESLRRNGGGRGIC